MRNNLLYTNLLSSPEAMEHLYRASIRVLLFSLEDPDQIVISLLKRHFQDTDDRPGISHFWNIVKFSIMDFFHLMMWLNYVVYIYIGFEVSVLWTAVFLIFCDYRTDEKVMKRLLSSLKWNINGGSNNFYIIKHYLNYMYENSALMILRVYFSQ